MKIIESRRGRSMKRYPKIYRIGVPGHRRRGKNYLLTDEVDALLTGLVVVEEKLDGKLIELDDEGYVIFKEDLKRKHTVAYTDLPTWEVGLDVWDPDEECFLNYAEKEIVFKVLGIPVAPMLFSGLVGGLGHVFDFLGMQSAFGAPRIEGVVIKNYDKGLFGKVVDPLFDQEVDESEHHLRRPYEMNRLGVTSYV